MNKKLLALLLAILMVAVSACAMAEDTEGGSTTPPSYTDATSVTIYKNYVETNESSGSTVPAEVFSVTQYSKSAADSEYTNTTVPDLFTGTKTFTYGSETENDVSGTASFDIALPTYAHPGIFTYVLKETAGNTAGVTYSTNSIEVKVTVIQQGNDLVRIAAIRTTDDTGNITKQQNPTLLGNQYDAAALTVKKNVTGSLGDRSKTFEITVQFTKPSGKNVALPITYTVGGTTNNITFAESETTKSVTISLAHDQSVTFNNIPSGTAYTVTETSYSDLGYTTTYDDYQNGTVVATNIETVVTNDKTGNIDTGVNTDNTPYILLMALVAIMALAFVAKKHSVRE